MNERSRGERVGDARSMVDIKMHVEESGQKREKEKAGCL